METTFAGSWVGWCRPALALACLMLLSMAGCGGGDAGGTAPPPMAPSITSQPVPVTVSEGSPATFAVTAAGSAPLIYQWQSSSDGGVSWTNVPGQADASSYTTSATTIAWSGYSFRVQVSNGAGMAISNAALLTVSALPKAPSVERQILPTATDAGILAVPGPGEAPHWAINPSPTVAAKGRLLVFIPGTQGVPAQYTFILRAGASRGLHAVGVNYPNQTAMGSLCQFSLDPDCYWTARNHVIFGTGAAVPRQALVSKADSIVNRLTKLILWLNAHHPSEGWGQYLLGDQTIDWSKVVLAGHSQGGGHAGVLAKTVALQRAVYFSSPEDWNELIDSPAGWTSARPNVTPSAQQYGFGSDRDTLVPNAHAFAHWDNMRLARPQSGPILVDDASPPFQESRQLRTALPPNPASNALTPALRNHGITVLDTSTPVTSAGTPLFDVNGVWAYLCFD